VPRIPLPTIPSILRHAADQFGPELAVVDGPTRLTFTELAEQAERTAAGLIGSGVAPGDRVAIWAPNSAAWIVASFGVYLAGAILVPINTRYRRPEAQHVLRTAGARLVFTVGDFPAADFAGMLSGMDGLSLSSVVLLSGADVAGTTSWTEFTDRAPGGAKDLVAARAASLREDSESDIIFTSGTTGAPKGAVLTHGASVRTYEAWSELVGLRHGDRYLVVYPFFHTAGLKSGVLACVLRGATVYPQPVFDVPTLMAEVAASRITVLPGPPTVFQSILDHPGLASFDLSSLRLSVTGAAVVPVAVVRAMRERLKFETVVTGYGMTETTGTISMCRHDDPPEVIAETVGRPLTGIEVRVVDDEGADVPPGAPGEFWVRGFNVMKGYFADPTATAAAITPDGWLKTGDVGYVDGGGNLRITDRRKDMFIVGGFNAYPAEIEACLLDHPAVAQVAVVGVPNHRLGEVGVAFVVPVTGATLADDDVVSWARERLANFKVPRRVVVCDGLPLTPSGKVMKHVLRESVGELGSQ
jgi:acyl-CoA synthetase (AMP-forming)/AMP-acid ligase II